MSPFDRIASIHQVPGREGPAQWEAFDRADQFIMTLTQAGALAIKARHPDMAASCECCRDVRHDVRATPSMTTYEGEGANADLLLCPGCAEEHVAEMNQRWLDYYSGLL